MNECLALLERTGHWSGLWCGVAWITSGALWCCSPVGGAAGDSEVPRLAHRLPGCGNSHPWRSGFHRLPMVSSTT